MSQVNHNYAYIRDVDGLTTWERLRVIRGFLTERRQALAVAQLGKRKFETTKHTMDVWDREQAEIQNSNLDDLLQDCIDEIAFLESYEARLTVEAEQERIPGKTDREMYEINWVKESRARLMEDIRAQVLTRGTIEPQTMKTLMKEPVVLDEAIALGLVNQQMLEMIKPDTFATLSNKSPLLLELETDYVLDI